MRDVLIDFCQSIKDYEAESGHKICDSQDDREAFEFVDIFLKDYKLEWRKPTEQDIRTDYKEMKRVWWRHGYEITSSILTFEMFRQCGKNCLLADHGNICPNVLDFKE